MGYLREGVEYGDNFVWGSGTFLLCFGNGIWTPTTASIADILASENSSRVEIFPEISWNSVTKRNEILIEETINLTEPLTFNRLFIIKNGSTQSNWVVNTVVNPNDEVTIIGNDFVIGERFILADTSDELEVTNVSGMNVTFSGQSRDFLFTDSFYDARGIFLTGVATENTVYSAFTDNFISKKFESIVT